MTTAIEKLTSTPVGKLLYKTVQPFVHGARHLAHPGIPNEQTITKVAYRGRTISIRHRRWSASDVLAIQQCFEKQQYDMPAGAHGEQIQRVYRQIIASGRKPLIIDCGANIGASITWFAARYPEAHIVGIEPAPDNFEFLQLNCAGLDVDLRQAGIGPEDGHAYIGGSGGEMGYCITDSGIPVDIVSIGTLLASKPESQYAPFLLKLDIEGSEKSLFAGDCTSINHFPLIILEPHDWAFPGQLCSRGFFRFHVAAGRDFCMNEENVGSIALEGPLSDPGFADAAAADNEAAGRSR
ncbi:FkbM family methyltransferase [Edaphobacter bradus]|uniref:FkbM family methyltransferase n=1 Tax=Edaphobacter bradus TaxID=2259016 RepID=UPI0021E00346|nr:FkbM family methyltransferase [Edaphobacter bradus]